MLVALRIDTDRCDQDQILVHVNAVDLDHQQIKAGEVGRHPLLSCAPPTAPRSGGKRPISTAQTP